MDGRIRRVAMVNGYCWEWTRDEWTYQAVHLFGTETVRLYYRMPDGTWSYGHARELDGRAPILVAEEMRDDIMRPASAESASA